MGNRVPASYFSVFFSRHISFLHSIHTVERERFSSFFTLSSTVQDRSEIRLRAVDDAVGVGVALLLGMLVTESTFQRGGLCVYKLTVAAVEVCEGAWATVVDAGLVAAAAAEVDDAAAAAVDEEEALTTPAQPSPGRAMSYA